MGMARDAEQEKTGCSEQKTNHDRSATEKGDALSQSLTQSLTGILASTTHQTVIDGLLHSIVNALPGAAHIKSADNFEYKITNQNTLSLLGMAERSQIVGKNDYDIASFMKWRWPSGLADDLQKIDHDVLFNNNPIIGSEHQPYINGDGLLVALTLTKIPLFDHEQNPYGLLTFAINTADLKNSERLRELYYSFYNDKKVSHEMFLNHIGINRLTKQEGFDNNILSERELDVLILLSKGKAPKEIAYFLGLSNRTVETHIDNAKIKFNCYNKSELIGLFLSCWNR